MECKIGKVFDSTAQEERSVSSNEPVLSSQTLFGIEDNRLGSPLMKQKQLAAHCSYSVNVESVTYPTGEGGGEKDGSLKRRRKRKREIMPHSDNISTESSDVECKIGKVFDSTAQEERSVSSNEPVLSSQTLFGIEDNRLGSPLMKQKQLAAHCSYSVNVESVTYPTGEGGGEKDGSLKRRRKRKREIMPHSDISTESSDVEGKIGKVIDSTPQEEQSLSSDRPFETNPLSPENSSSTYVSGDESLDSVDKKFNFLNIKLKPKSKTITTKKRKEIKSVLFFAINFSIICAVIIWQSIKMNL